MLLQTHVSLALEHAHEALRQVAKVLAIAEGKQVPPPDWPFEEDNGTIPGWCHPYRLCGAMLLFFSLIRIWLGGAPYLPSRAWYALCFFIPVPFLAVGIGAGGMCAPLKIQSYGGIIPFLDWQTCLHLLLVLAYCQLDLWIGKRWVESNRFPLLPNFLRKRVVALYNGLTPRRMSGGDGNRPLVGSSGNMSPNGRGAAASLNALENNLYNASQKGKDFGSINIFAILAKNFHPLKPKS